MKIIKKLVAIVPLVSCLGLAAQAQSLYVKQTNSTQTSYPIATVETIKFSPGKVHINKANGTDSYNLTDLRYLSFKDFTVGILSPNSSELTAFSIFPNPANGQLNLSFAKALTTDALLTIYSIEGKVIQQISLAKAQGNFTIDVSGLTPGIYLCSLNNSKEATTQKFIKN